MRTTGLDECFGAVKTDFIFGWADFGSDSYREYDAGVKALALKLMHVVIAGLEVDDTTHFDQYLTKCSALFRWNYYPPCPEPEKTVGLTAHTDYNLLTVLHQGEIGGLQVEKDGQWIAIRPREGAFAINVGDTLQVLVFIYLKNPFHMRDQFFFNPSTTTRRSNAKIIFITSLNFLEVI
jgi:isopenicillin N synthase-like dioxygenase